MYKRNGSTTQTCDRSGFTNIIDGIREISLGKRSSMKNSSDSSICFIWQETQHKNIRADALIIGTPLKSTTKASEQLYDSQIEKASTHSYGLKS